MLSTKSMNFRIRPTKMNLKYDICLIYVICVCLRIVVSSIVLYFCFVCLRLVYTMLQVSLDCPFFMALSVFSKVYVESVKIGCLLVVYPWYSGFFHH